jgi:mono/diheme cytochrome c family protein
VRRGLGSGLLAAATGALVLQGCSGGETLAPEAARGRDVYLAQCTACHAMDPALAGPVGPPIKGASQELLEAKVLRGGYPPGYTPKRQSAVMQPMPHLAPNIPDLAAFLR